MQEVVDEAAAEETNGHTQGRKINNLNNEQGKQQSLRIQNLEIVGKQQQKLGTEGTQQE